MRNLSAILQFDGSPVKYLQPHQILKLERFLNDFKDLEDRAKSEVAKKVKPTGKASSLSIGSLKCEVILKPNRLNPGLLESILRKVSSPVDRAGLKRSLYIAFMLDKNDRKLPAPLERLESAVKRSVKAKHALFGKHAYMHFYEKALEKAAANFCYNVKSRLSSSGPENTRDVSKLAVGVDPGIRSGFKICVFSTLKDGSFLGCMNGLSSLPTGLGVVHFLGNKRAHGCARVREIFEGVKGHDIMQEGGGDGHIDVIIGGGTGSDEVADVIAEALSKTEVNVKFHRISEDGASVYSTTKEAMEEFRDEDAVKAEWLGALSIGRRFVSPLSELIKIPPRSLGFGMVRTYLEFVAVLNRSSRIWDDRFDCADRCET